MISLKRRSLLAGAAAAAMPLPSIATGKERVSMLLALGIDVSSSVNRDRYRLQIDGYLGALRDPEIIELIESSGGIGLMAYEWGSYPVTRVPWMKVADAESMEHFRAAFSDRGRLVSGKTGLGRAMRFGHRALLLCPFQSRRLVLDLSGDGNDNTDDATLIPEIRNGLVQDGVVVNGLPIRGEQGSEPIEGIVAYYEQNVVGGRGSFAQPADSYAEFPSTIQRKLRRELVV
jgi:hypothetical protein